MIANYSAVYDAAVIIEDSSKVDDIFAHIEGTVLQNLKNETINDEDVDDAYIDQVVIEEELGDEGRVPCAFAQVSNKMFPLN